MGYWVVQHYDHYGIPLGDFRPMSLSDEIVNSDEGSVSYELAISDPLLARDAFAPYRTDYRLYRIANNGDSAIISGGMHTSRNLSNNRDTVLVGGADWFHYLKKRIYPFDPVAYVTQRDWVSWPKKWGTGTTNGVELKTIVSDIIQAMVDEEPFPNVPPFTVQGLATGVDGRYKIYPADRTTIFDHINTLSEMDDGFEWEIDPQTFIIRLFSPDRDINEDPIYMFRLGSDPASDGSVVSVDWTDNGPAATWILGLGAGPPHSIKRGGNDNYSNDARTYRRLDAVVDFGTVASQSVLDRLTSAEGFRSRFAQKTLRLRVANPELLTPNFYTGGRPRGLIGRRIFFQHDFEYHRVQAYYRINKITIDVDNAGNEEVEFDLEQINA